MEMSKQAAQELAEGSIAISRVAELEARVAELEGRGCQLEAEKVEAKKAMRKEKHSKELDFCPAESFLHCLSLTCLFFRAGGLHQGQRGAAQAPRDGRGSGGRDRGEAPPRALGPTRYDSEIMGTLSMLSWSLRLM